MKQILLLILGLGCLLIPKLALGDEYNIHVWSDPRPVVLPSYSEPCPTPAQGHYAEKEQRVLVSPGRYEWRWIEPVTRACCKAWHCHEVILVCPGRYERVWHPPVYETRLVRCWVPGPEIVRVDPYRSLDLEALMTTEALVCDKIQLDVQVTNPNLCPVPELTVQLKLPQGLVLSESSKVGAGSLIRFGTVAGNGTEMRRVRLGVQSPGVYTLPLELWGGGKMLRRISVQTTVGEPQLVMEREAPLKAATGMIQCARIKVVNQGSGRAEEILLTDRLPEGAVFVSATYSGQHSNGETVWQLNTLGPGESALVEVCYRLETEGPVTGEATVSAYCAGPVTQATVTVVENITGLQFEVIDLNDPVLVGERETYVITVKNQGRAPASNVVITCQLDEAQKLISQTGATAGTGIGRTVQFNPLPHLAPGQIATWKVEVQAMAQGDVRFRASLMEDHLDEPVEEMEATRFF